MGKTDRLRIVLADDHEVVRRGLRLLLAGLLDCDVIDVGDAENAVSYATDPDVDLLLLDVRLGTLDGLWALREIRAVRPDLPVVMVSTFSDTEHVQAAIDQGANGYVLKEATTGQLREAIEIALSGKGLYLHPAAAQAVATRRRDVPSGPLADLTEREMQILSQLAEGATNEEIGATLFLSEKTVKSYLSSIFRKLGVSNRTQAALKAMREGISIAAVM
jgi:DNA-binding NarL/FixJ family response regulator